MFGGKFQNAANFMGGMIIRAVYRLLLFVLCQLKKKYGPLKFILAQDHIGLQISKRHVSLWDMAITFFASRPRPSFTNISQFKILPWESMENHKLGNIWKR